MKIKTISIQLMMLLVCFFSCYTASYAGMDATEQSVKHQLKQYTNTKHHTFSKKEKKQLKELLQKPNEAQKKKKKKGRMGILFGVLFLVAGGLIMLAGSVGSSILLVALGVLLGLIGAFFLLRGLLRLIF